MVRALGLKIDCYQLWMVQLWLETKMYSYLYMFFQLLVDYDISCNRNLINLVQHIWGSYGYHVPEMNCR